ncbi:MAG: bifunctional 3-deoxy-7-phosphoheptulonate synthase/chorismate mutase [Planctomycetes bacterium]|nr:bifunctional 3-deoxy-7-phosphoheptulonate synthase/chorismate mutase [Planctomycetota bacterium]
MDPLLRSRSEIDRLDREFLRLLAERMQAVRVIGTHKGENPDAPFVDEERERVVLEAWTREAEKLGLSGYFAGRVLREILNWSRRDQERFLDAHAKSAGAAKAVRVAYQGVPACYSDLTITKVFASRDVERIERLGRKSFVAAMDALEAGEVEYALLPIENTIAGSINEVYDLLAKRNVVIVGEEVWPVEHCLVGVPGTVLEQVRTIRSHPVALQQCQRFLDGLVGVRAESWHDTAGAAESISIEQDARVGAIASEEAAQQYGLAVIARGIADERVNLTRFLLIGRAAEKVDPRRPAKTSLVFAVNHRRGALLQCLAAFNDQGISLTKLESRPQPATPWEYVFYVDFEGHVSDARVEAALAALREHTNHLKILGSYPRRTESPLERRQLPVVPAEIEVVEPLENEPASVHACPAEPKPATNPNLKLSSSKHPGQRTQVDVNGVVFGGERFVVIAGPCAVENRAQMLDAAAMAKAGGASMLRGGAFKPRTSPYAFQGLGFAGLELLVEAGHAYELPVVTEVLRPEDVEKVAETADMLQIGARNMQNFSLLREVGRARRPVLLKRGMSATIEELLLAAEYVMAGGNNRVVLCERGIRTFETATRNTLDISAIPVLRARTHLPVIVDPSHAAGVRDLVVPLALAAAAVGADGVIIEAHPRPGEALCDKDQALTGDDLVKLFAQLKPIVEARGRTL